MTSRAGWGSRASSRFQKFVEEGGVLVTLGAASFFPAEFGLARRVDASRPSAQFYAPGPIVEAEITQPAHPSSTAIRRRRCLSATPTGRC